MNNTIFYQSLPQMHAFEALFESATYHTLPSDWIIIVADIEGSTHAIESGRYKDVNMVGAACITAAVNTCKSLEIPYVFGGDGATIAIPPEHKENVTHQLLCVKHMAKKFYGLSLRVGAVPVSTIQSKGKEIRVAKFTFPTGCSIAMFQGGGTAVADTLVKSGEYEIHQTSDEEPNLEGLTCRWKPIKSNKGKILTLLIASHEPGDLYAEIYAKIQSIISKEQNPVKPEKLRYHWPSISLLKKERIVWQQGKWVKNILSTIGFVLLFKYLNRFNKSIGNFDIVNYRNDMITNSDYRKFDDMLRMVIDCSTEEVTKIEAYLYSLHTAKKIAFGTHKSSSALMTCFVTALESDKHIHFVDGNDGGYALAAKQLKQQQSM